MGRFMRGDIVVLPFPFSDLSSSKRRPAVVLVSLMGDDVVLCQVTSQTKADRYSVAISEADFREGNLNRDSNARPNRLFTADSKIIAYRACRLSEAKTAELIQNVISILNS